jgi:hypothetical protein
MNEPLKLRQVGVQAPAIVETPSVKVDLDERCFLFPDGKLVSHLMIAREANDHLGFDAVFPFNNTRLPSRFLTLSRSDARLFIRELLDSVYAAKSGFVLRDTLKISIVVVANGYRIEFQQADAKVELFLSTGVIWRVTKALLLVMDEASPVVSN